MAKLERVLVSTAPPDDNPEGAFYIPAERGPARPRQTLKHNDMFVVLDSFGDIGASDGGPDGLFHADTRHLSRLELLINGVQPLLLGSNVKDDNVHLYADLTNPDIYDGEAIVLYRDTLHIGRTIFVHNGVMRQRIALVNFGSDSIDIALTLSFAGDFADVFEVRGMKRPGRGRCTARQSGHGSVTLAYLGLDGATRETALKFDPRPDALSNREAAYRIRLGPKETRPLFVAASCHGRLERPPAAFITDLIGARREIKAATRTIATVETGNKVLNEILCRSCADLYMLISGTPHGPYPYAGIPWYSTPFGRDALITAIQMLWLDARIARGVLKFLAHHQAHAADAEADAEPGKILHEMRHGEMAALREVPFGLYYGSVDSTPLFVVLAGLYAERTGDWPFIEHLWPSIERALAWIDGPADADRDGFIEYYRVSDRGLANQGWKDSLDAVFHADGHLAQGPLALVEVQGYVYLAKRLAARCARTLGDAERGAVLDREADALKARFEKAFWSDALGTYALALDGAKEPCLVRTSNPGHALFCGIAAPERARSVAAGLLQPAFFSGWGIRTVAAGEARYNPMSYHNGSIWPHDNALTAGGFARYGLKEETGTIFDGLMEAAAYMDHRRLPELFCGFRRRRGQGPTLYPVACSPQAWASGSPFHLIQSMLGLEIDQASRRVRLVNPFVPHSVEQITIRNVQMRDARVDFRVRRESGTGVSLEVLRANGTIDVSLVFEPAATP